MNLNLEILTIHHSCDIGLFRSFLPRYVTFYVNLSINTSVIVQCHRGFGNDDLEMSRNSRSGLVCVPFRPSFFSFLWQLDQTEGRNGLS